MEGLIVVAVVVALVVGHHAGHAHGPYITVPGPFGTRIGHRL
jgi:hypothetical protein